MRQFIKAWATAFLAIEKRIYSEIVSITAVPLNFYAGCKGGILEVLWDRTLMETSSQDLIQLNYKCRATEI